MKLTPAEIDLILKRRMKAKRKRKRASENRKKSTKFFNYDNSDYQKQQGQRGTDSI